MHTFQGRSHTWELTLSIESVARIRAYLAVDLLKADQPDAQGHVPVLTLYSDPGLLIQCCELLCRQQIRQRFAAELSEGRVDEITGLPPASLDLFVTDLSDGCYERMRDAFLEELRDFFRRLGLAPRAALIAKQIEAIERSQADSARQIAELNLDRALPTVDLQQVLNDSIPGNTSNNSLPWPESTSPDRSPSGN